MDRLELNKDGSVKLRTVHVSCLTIALILRYNHNARYVSVVGKEHLATKATGKRVIV